ncbi:glycosyltransferase [Tessaracoccus antarcticus]|nr:glycosyl transferase [Tessaracoccus antarcticus]
MQSFGAPRPTTNPYIHMLDESLAKEPGIEHLRFDYKRALLGKYDVLHFHWPETLLGGTTRPKRLVRALLASALLLRLRWGKVTVVRTVHNVELPSGISRWERWFLQGVEDHTSYRIALNQHSASFGQRSCVIPHGHYIDWFAGVPPVEAEDDTLGFVGLIRQYKGVESLIGAFKGTLESLPDTILRICGNPTSELMRQEVESLAREDSRIILDLRYLSEEAFATAIMGMRGVVLPYRFMHNSGAVLAALSLGRPVLVPDNEMNRDLASEVGPGWIHHFSDDLTPGDVIAFREAVSALPVEPPRLGARGWADAGRRHAEAYATASRRRA